MAKKDKDRYKNSIYMINVSSFKDIARCVYNFDFTFENLFFDNKLKLLFAFGESIGTVTVVYTIPLNEKQEFLRYTPPSANNKENAELTNVKNQDSSSDCYINIIPLSLEKLKINKKDLSKEVMQMALDNSESIIKLAVSKSGNENNLLRLYCYRDIKLKKAVVFGFDMIEALNNEKRFIYYVFENTNNIKNFAVYNYRDNRTEFIDLVGEHPYLYLKIINLNEKPNFMNV